MLSFKRLHSKKINQEDFEEKQEVYEAWFLQRRVKPILNGNLMKADWCKDDDGTTGKCVTWV